MTKRNYKKLAWVIGAVLVVVVAWLLFYLNRPWSEDDTERAKVKVQQRVCFALLADGQEVAYFSRFSAADSVMVGLTAHRDSAWHKSEGTGVWVNSSSLFPSANGLVLAVDERADMEEDAALISHAMNDMLERNMQYLQAECRRMESMTDEVDYYLKRHSIFDNEYIAVANFSYALASGQKHMEQMQTLLDSVTRVAKNVEVKVVREYQMDTLALHPVDGFWKAPVLSRLHSDHPHVRFVVLGNDSLTEIPDTCTAFSTPLFCRTDFSDRVQEWNDLFPRLSAPPTHIEGTALRSLELYHEVETDSLCLYEGASEDTLSNQYHGQMTEKGTPQGYGMMRYANGDYYEGEWLDGNRHGHGFLAANGQMLRAGEWEDDRYLGEKMTYTDNRVYGIDISRYQHEIGKQVYPINWNAMRITSLGKRNSKQVEGNINFPVSFVYIKSTQGITIQSAYYQQDSRDARAHGILCGAYHFFSVKANGKEQAHYFLDNTEILPNDLPPVLDVEPTDGQIEQYGGEDVLFDAMRTWLTIVERAVGKRPILYVSQTFIKTHLVHAPDLCQNYPFWIARYNVYRPEVKLHFWQLCYDGRVAGIHGGVDINIFNGYQEQYDEWVATLTSRQ